MKIWIDLDGVSASYWASRLIARFIFLLLLAGNVAAQTVTTTEYYDNRDAAFIWKSDDWYPPRHTFFTNAAALARANHIVFSPAIFYMASWGDADWAIAQDWIDNGYCLPMNHSYTHPVNINTTTYSNEYLLSRQILTNKLNWPWQWTYNGKEYGLNLMAQFGGCTNIDVNYVYGFCASNGYMGISIWSNWTFTTSGYGTTNWVAWDSNISSNGSYRFTGFTVAMAWRLNSPTTWARYSPTNAIANRWVYTIMGHSYVSNENVSGIYSNEWRAFFENDFGNRKNVWYTDPNSLYTYHYLQTRALPDIALSNAADCSIITVAGDHEERVKYGLSYPLTYKFTKPSDWMPAVSVYVYYRDAVNTNWTLMEEKTTNDYFTGINAYRDANNVVYISQGLPQTADTFDLLVKPRYVRRPIEAFAYDGTWFLADIIKEDVVPTLQYTTNLLNPAWVDVTPISIETNTEIYRLYIDSDDRGNCGFFRAVKDTIP
jgi:hypothetical protein